MKTIYEDSYTRLAVHTDTLHIHHQGRNGSMSFTEIKDVSGRSEASFGATSLQPLIEVTIDALSRPVAFVLAVSDDGDGYRLLELIQSLRVV